MENHGGMISPAESSSFVHQSSLAFLPAESSSSKAGRTEERNYEFGLTKHICSYFEGVFNMP
jgi:hypothetical protein